MEQPFHLAELDDLSARITSGDGEALDELDRDWSLPLRRVLASSSDPDAQVRERACALLGGWLDRRAALAEAEMVRAVGDTLARLLETDPDEDVRVTAVQCTRPLPAPVPLLITAAHDLSEAVRFMAAFGLACLMEPWFSGPRARYRQPVQEALLELMDDEDEEVREWTALGLGTGRHDTPAARERLKRALDDADPDVRGAAALTLVWFGDASAGPGVKRLLESGDPAPNTFLAADYLGDRSLLSLVKQASERFRRGLSEEEAATAPPFELDAIEKLGRRVDADP